MIVMKNCKIKVMNCFGKDCFGSLQLFWSDAAIDP